MIGDAGVNMVQAGLQIQAGQLRALDERVGGCVRLAPS
jgi:hypothetical protein